MPHKLRTAAEVPDADNSQPDVHSSPASGILSDRFRCPAGPVEVLSEESLSQDNDSFRFGPDLVCYGRCSHGSPGKYATGRLDDVHGRVSLSGTLSLPFDAA
jgi:hypothetical protein